MAINYEAYTLAPRSTLGPSVIAPVGALRFWTKVRVGVGFGQISTKVRFGDEECPRCEDSADSSHLRACEFPPLRDLTSHHKSGFSDGVDGFFLVFKKKRHNLDAMKM
jgi:hypothetical protein